MSATGKPYEGKVAYSPNSPASKDDAAPAFGQVFDACSVLQALYQRAEPNLSADELRWLAGSLDLAQYMASKSAKLADAVAEQFTYDHELQGDRLCVLSRKPSMASLLYTLSESFTHIEGLILLGTNAAYQRGVLLHGEEE